MGAKQDLSKIKTNRPQLCFHLGTQRQGAARPLCMVKAHQTVTSGVSCMESGETGYKVEMEWDSFGTVRECGEEEEPRVFVLSGASCGHTCTDTGRGAMVWQPQHSL